MIIPEDGCLPKITRTGFSAFNNVMIIKVPEKFRSPDEPIYQLATLDRSKKGERWPADDILDALMNPTSEEPELDSNNKEKCSNDKEENATDYKHFTSKRRGRFLPEKLSAPPRIPPETTQNFPQNSSFPNWRKPPPLLGVRPVQEPYVDKDPCNQNFARPPLNPFSNGRSRGRQENYSMAGLASCRVRHAQDERLSAHVAVEPTLVNRPFNEDFRAMPERPVTVEPALVNIPFNEEFSAMAAGPSNIYPNPSGYPSFAHSIPPFNEFHGRPPLFPTPPSFHQSTIPNSDFVDGGRMNNASNHFGDFNGMPGNLNLDSYDQPRSFNNVRNNMHPCSSYDVNYNEVPNNNFNNYHDKKPHFDQGYSFSNNSNQPYYRGKTGNAETNHNFNGTFRDWNQNMSRGRRPKNRKFNGGGNQRGRNNYRFQKRKP